MNQKEFLETLYGYCEAGTLCLRSLPSKSQVFIPFNDYAEIKSYCLEHIEENVYFAVATREGGGTKKHIVEIPAVWIDIDFKDISPVKAKRALWDFQIRPTLMVESGGGYHAYYKLKEPATKEDIPDIEKVNKTLAALLNGDPAAVDASRILRMPVTANVKYDPPKAVKVVYHDAKLEYDLPDLISICESTSIIGKSGHAKLKSTQTSTLSTSVHIDLHEGHRDNSLFHIANSLARGGMSEDNMVKTLGHIGAACVPPFDEKEILAKVRSAMTRNSDRERPIAESVREWVLSTGGRFLSSDIYRDLQLTTRKEKKACSMALSRLKDEELIEKHGDRAGVFRVIDKNCDTIDFLSVVADPIVLKWPIEGLENMVEIFPGNIIVIAGEPNTGKTAFVLSLIYLNQKRHDIHYFSSEMGGREIRKRLLMFEDMNLTEWKFHAKERYTLDSIEPDAVNVIDFLEIHDNFFEVGGKLKQIHDKLNKEKGIAIVALQKNRGTDFGLGGQRGMEIPRLYLTISSEFPGGRFKIEKAKNWATTTNPNQYSVKFKLIGGCHFVLDGDWVLTGR